MTLLAPKKNLLRKPDMSICTHLIINSVRKKFDSRANNIKDNTHIQMF